MVRKIEPHVNDLIAVVKGTRVVRRKKREGAVKSAERQERREQQIRQAMEECGAREDLSPEWLAQHVGLPIEYARWYLGSRKLWSSFGARLG